ncbi:hypothetical protein DENSPDRAFT_849988 [Dentipellis sp. KUC8613]|nr:hypothetical protein DENSPDRAFT_849988 [Dentipellis sp. KUC8613]
MPLPPLLLDEFFEAVVSDEPITSELHNAWAQAEARERTRDLLSTYSEYADVDRSFAVKTLTNGVDYVVYPDNHADAGDEAEFIVFGIVAALTIPTPASNRSVFRPNSVMQTFRIVGPKDPNFELALNARRNFKIFLEQYCVDGTFAPYDDRKVYGMAAISASSPLLLHVDKAEGTETKRIPRNIDPNGDIARFLRKDSRYVYTEDNHVEYRAIQPNFATLEPDATTARIEPGSFRVGQLVELSVSFRSVHSANDRRNVRRFQPVLRRVILRSRTGAIMLSERVNDHAVAEVSGSTSSSAVPPRKRRYPDSDDDEISARSKLARLEI